MTGGGNTWQTPRLVDSPRPLSSRSSEVFCGSNGDILKENDTIKFPKLAQTYRKIAEEGPDAFYEGELAKRLVDDIQARGSVSNMRTAQNAQIFQNRVKVPRTSRVYYFIIFMAEESGYIFIGPGVGRKKEETLLQQLRTMAREKKIV